MSISTPSQEKLPDKYKSVDDGSYRGYDPQKPQTYREKENRRRTGSPIADDIDFDVITG